jgi:hypothetical protein
MSSKAMENIHFGCRLALAAKLPFPGICFVALIAFLGIYGKTRVYNMYKYFVSLLWIIHPCDGCPFAFGVPWGPAVPFLQQDAFISLFAVA